MVIDMARASMPPSPTACGRRFRVIRRTFGISREFPKSATLTCSVTPRPDDPLSVGSPVRSPLTNTLSLCAQGRVAGNGAQRASAWRRGRPASMGAAQQRPQCCGAASWGRGAWPHLEVAVNHRHLHRVQVPHPRRDLSGKPLSGRPRQRHPAREHLPQTAVLHQLGHEERRTLVGDPGACGVPQATRAVSRPHGATGRRGAYARGDGRGN